AANPTFDDFSIDHGAGAEGAGGYELAAGKTPQSPVGDQLLGPQVPSRFSGGSRSGGLGGGMPESVSAGRDAVLLYDAGFETQTDSRTLWIALEYGNRSAQLEANGELASGDQ